MIKRSTLALCFVFFAAQMLMPLGAVAQQPARVSVQQDLSYGEEALQGESSLYKEVEVNSPLDRKVTIRVSNVPIGTFLNSISSQAKINFIMSEDIADKKKVSASLTNVTVREALDTLLRVQGLSYQRIGKSDSYVITPRSNEAPNVITKVYTLNYVSLQAQGSATQSLNSLMPADVTSTAIASGGGSSTDINISGMAAGDPGGGIAAMPNLGASLTGPGGAGATGTAILDIVKSVLSRQGRIAIDGRTNKLIITDVPEVFPQVESILTELDVKAPQILIEAQIVEVSKGSGFDVGFTWGGTNGAMAEFKAGKTELPWSYFTSNPTGGILKWFGIDGDASGGGGGGGGGGTGTDAGGQAMSLDFTSFSVLFNALMTSSEARSLGKPKVITINNNPAVITSSREAAISTVTRNDGAGSTGTSTTQGVERRRVGLTLTVTPQVNKEGFVTLTVAPSYSDLVASELAESYDTVTRALSTQVRVRSGQTVVLGGLLQSTEKENVQKVPLLGQIPIVGWLFTHKQKSKSTTDLIIFLTPTVLSE